jgi:beta-lactamase regulating signal transducer with metallopeptidase domain
MTLANVTALLGPIVDHALRAAIVVGLVASVVTLVRLRRASAELTVWTVVALGILAMPIAAQALPHWRIESPLAAVIVPTPVRTLGQSLGFSSTKSLTPTVRGESAPQVLSAREGSRLDRGAAIAGVACGVYVAGVVVALVRVLRGLLRWRAIRRQGLEIDPDPVAHRVATAVSLHRVPTMVEADVRVPCVVGLTRPAVLLPRSWQNWEASMRECILVHEFSHIARRDALVRLGVASYCALFWFSPAAWWLHQRVAALTEDASDDAVLERGAEPAAYAATLLCFASRLPASAGVVAMSDSRRVERRLMRITRWTPTSQASNARFVFVAATACVIATAIAIAAPQAAEPIRLPVVAEPLVQGPVSAPRVVLGAMPPDSQKSPVQRPIGDARMLVRAGESAALSVPFEIRRVSVVSAAIADATSLSPKQLLVRGLAVGTTRLLVWGDGDRRAEFSVEVALGTNASEQTATTPKTPQGPAWAVSWPPPPGDTISPMLLAFLFDLQTLPGDARQKAADNAKAVAFDALTRASVGLRPYTWIAVWTTDRGYYYGAPALLQDFTASPDEVSAAFDRVAHLPPDAGQVGVPFDQAVTAACHLAAATAAHPETLIDALDPRLQRLLRLSSDRPGYPELDVYSNGVSRGLLAAFDPERLSARCLGEAPAVAVSWKDEKAFGGQPVHFASYAEYRGQGSGRKLLKPIAASLASPVVGAPVRLSGAAATLEAGYVSVTVTNVSAKTIRSVSFAASVASGGKTRIFTRVGPAMSVPAGGHVDLATAMMEPADFEALSAEGGTASIGLLAVEFEDGTRWSADPPRGGGATSPVASGRR